MKKTILTIAISLFLFSCILAMYSGETETFDFGFEIVNCSIVNNTYNLDGLNLTWNNTEAIVSTDINFFPDNFTISCWVLKQGEVVESSSGSSGTWKGNQGISIKKGYTNYFSKNQVFKFKLKEEHKLTLQEITKNSVSLKIQSEPFYVNLSIGDELILDLEKDNYYDLRIVLLDIINGKAKIFLEEVNIKIEEDEPNNVTNIINVTKDEIPTEDGTDYTLVFLLVGSIFIIILIFLWIIIRDIKKEGFVNKTINR